MLWCKRAAVFTLLMGLSASAIAEEGMLELRDAVVVRPDSLSAQEETAINMLVEEVAKRSGIRWSIVRRSEKHDAPIAIRIGRAGWIGDKAETDPQVFVVFRDQLRAEGYGIIAGGGSNGMLYDVIVGGKDARGVLFGCGRLLRELRIKPGSVAIPKNFYTATSPAYPIRGHQIGFRARANSWDAWTVAEMEQYIRELAFFGVNSIENIPFQDSDKIVLGKVDRRTMNTSMSEICAKYGLDYWVWTPADFDLKDEKLRAEELEKHKQLYEDCPELTGVFFPGGDPGDNEAALVIPFLEDVAKLLASTHPKAKIWLSMQGFDKSQVEVIVRYVQEKLPTWLGGLVVGPSSPPTPETRLWLPKQYQLRLYPDITHNKICQYPVPWWDPALALTLGREAINPRPAQYRTIHNWFAPYSDGFISYSDGVHDDVNKAVWSALSWDPDYDLRQMLVEYARVFFASNVAEDAADGIFALERNWRGPLAENGGVEATLGAWKALEARAPELKGNWRWQMCLVRAYYDAYVRQRLIRETKLEQEANETLLLGIQQPQKAMTMTLQILAGVDTEPTAPELRARIVELCEALFQSIDLQTSVEKYHASGAERGAILDFVDYPLNNRWWLEDEFTKIAALPTDDEKRARLQAIATWENPGPGSYYDDVGHPGKSPHVKRAEETVTEPGEEAHPEPTLWWWDNGKSRARLSWQSSMNWPLGVVYEGIDPSASYTVRTTGYGQALLRIDGERVMPTLDGKERGEFKEFPVDPKYMADRKLVITWDRPTDENHLNWRQQSHLSEIWLLKK